jgi:GNAT superfamily N-acetyltransferase
MAGFTVRPLDTSTWDAFAALVEEHNGVWGGCWCLEFHPEGNERSSVAARKARKHERVRAGTAHAALVFDGDAAIGWAQFGPTAELTRIKHRRAYETGVVEPPDWRITCFLVHKQHRGKGVASAALAGAVEQIAGLGGGTVEAYPEDTTDRDVQGRLLHSASLSLFEKHGFVRRRPIGKRHWVVSRVVGAA